jgi:hypothetical protein
LFYIKIGRDVDLEFDHPGEMEDITEKGSDKSQGDFIKLDFSSFVLSLSSTVLVGIGEIPDPITKETKKNIGLAKQMIDIINMLKEKTKGNLTKEEDELIQGLCSELKMKYLQAVNFK